MTDNEIVKALYSMYRATVYKDTITMSKETVIGLYEYFNRQKAEIERLEDKVNSFGKIRRAYQRLIHESMPNIQTALDNVLNELEGDENESTN